MPVVAGVLLVLFAAQLRTVLHGDQSGAGVLTLAAWSGLLLTGAGAMAAAAVHLALVNAADHRLAAAAQSVNVLDNYMPVAIVGGIAVFGLGAASRPCSARSCPGCSDGPRSCSASSPCSGRSAWPDCSSRRSGSSWSGC